jgi:hypothetical protein
MINIFKNGYKQAFHRKLTNVPIYGEVIKMDIVLVPQFISKLFHYKKNKIMHFLLLYKK